MLYRTTGMHVYKNVNVTIAVPLL